MCIRDRDIIEKLKQEWIGSNPLRKGWWGYCISEKGLPHVHMVLEDTGSCRFTKVKKAYPTAHLEPTKGNKKQVLAYIKKEPPFDEKGEQVLVFTSYGNIEGNKRYINWRSFRIRKIQIVKKYTYAGKEKRSNSYSGRYEGRG